jgi:hypothetical protein
VFDLCLTVQRAQFYKNGVLHVLASAGKMTGMLDTQWMPQFQSHLGAAFVSSIGSLYNVEMIRTPCGRLVHHI